MLSFTWKRFWYLTGVNKHLYFAVVMLFWALYLKFRYRWQDIFIILCISFCRFINSQLSVTSLCYLSLWSSRWNQGVVESAVSFCSVSAGQMVTWCGPRGWPSVGDAAVSRSNAGANGGANCPLTPAHSPQLLRPPVPGTAPGSVKAGQESVCLVGSPNLRQSWEAGDQAAGTVRVEDICYLTKPSSSWLQAVKYQASLLFFSPSVT